MSDEIVQTWAEETIEHWLPEKGLVYVFRWVPDYAPYDGHRNGVHPTFEEWLDDLRGAVVGLTDPGPRVRQVYEQEQIGVAGHRPMTPDERAEHIEALAAEIRRCERQLGSLLPPVAGGTRDDE